MSAPQTDQERYERWKAVLAQVDKETATQMAQQLVQELGPMDKATAKAFREALSNE